MTTRRPCDPQGWNAGLLKALALPDGAFRLYVWLRLHARLDTGKVEISQLDLAKALNRGRSTIRTSLRILEQAGVCRMQFLRIPGARGWIQVTDDYWPYERVQPERDPELGSYLGRVRAILHERACVRCPFSAADDLLVREWYTRGIPLEHVSQAILLGCARKYVSWRNGGRHTPIASVHYFAPILVEIEDQKPAADYWDYIRERIERLERQWLNGKGPNGSAGNLVPPALKSPKEGSL